MQGYFKLQFFFVSLILVFLNACSSSKDGDENTLQSSQDKGYEIKSFDITGTSPDIDDTAPINSGTNNGAFSISWYFSEQASTYTTKLFFSSDDVLSSEDTEFYSLNCQGGPNDLCTAIIGISEDCIFDTQNEISCHSEYEDAANLTNKLPTLPYDGFIIIKSCEFLSTVECDTPIAHAVQLQ